MDLTAYSLGEILEAVMQANGIEVPRFRGARLMELEEKISDESLQEALKDAELSACEEACESDFEFKAHWREFGYRTDKIKKRYIKYDNKKPVSIKWDKLHGYKRKTVKYTIRKDKQRIIQNFETFNKYCGREDVLYIHARIGGWNWEAFKGSELMKQPWFLEKCDDAYDSTYCDIYAKIDPNTAREAFKQIKECYEQINSNNDTEGNNE